jgi:hypothetical protein
MGVASSQNSNNDDGKIYFQLINPLKVSSSSSVATKLTISHRARIIKKLDHNLLWDNFLKSQFMTFALTPAELHGLLVETMLPSSPSSASLSSVTSSFSSVAVPVSSDAPGGKDKTTKALVEAEIKDYVDQVMEVVEKDHVKSIDFMSVLSSVVLLSSDIPLELKIDILFQYILLNPSSHDFSFEDFLVGVSSFDKGIAYAMNERPCSVDYLKEIASQWMALADPHHRNPHTFSSSSSSSSHLHPQDVGISEKAFFDFCSNRQHLVRRLLECLSSLDVIDNKESNLSEVVDSIDSFKRPVTGGDEWMANPAWIKTAERMIPPEIAKDKKLLSDEYKPSSNLSVDWIHGYRGFDCRNNVKYLEAKGNLISFTAAAVSVVQDNSSSASSWKDRLQHYFSEHSDDIISIAVFKDPSPSSSSFLIASGEIGKNPAVYLYSYDGGSASFESLACMKGCHSKGIAQLAFSGDGKLLYSVSVEYNIAIYCCDRSSSKNFGKLLVSCQGPKEKILHIVSCSAASSSSSSSSSSPGVSPSFITCGEKHLLLWNYNEKGGSLKQEQCSLGKDNKNKTLLSLVRLSGGEIVASSSEGDLFQVEGKSLVPLSIMKEGSSSSSGHGKAAINALAATKNGLLISGDKDGKIVFWMFNNNQQHRITAVYEMTVTLDDSGLLVPIESLTSVITPVGTSSSVGSSTTKKSASSTGKASSAVGDEEGGGTGPGKGKKGVSIRSLDVSSDSLKLLIGTQYCEIVEFIIKDKSFSFETIFAGEQKGFTKREQLMIPRLLASSHYSGEVWGLAVRPINEQNVSQPTIFATVGDDGYVRFWNLNDHSPIAYANLGGMARACCFSPDGLYLAIGFGGRLGNKKGKNPEDGIVKILRCTLSPSSSSSSSSLSCSLTQIAEIKEAKQWISVLRYSPDGSTLAVGARDNAIYFYSVPNQYRRKGKFTKHNAGINQLDFSSDGKYIQSCCR